MADKPGPTITSMTVAMRSIPERSKFLMSRTVLRRCRRRFADLGRTLLAPDAGLAWPRAVFFGAGYVGGKQDRQTPTNDQTEEWRYCSGSNGFRSPSRATDQEVQLKGRALSCRPAPGFPIFVSSAIVILAVSPVSAAGNGSSPPPSEAIFIAAILVILVMSRVLGEAMQRLGQPAVIGHLIAGILLGPS